MWYVGLGEVYAKWLMKVKSGWKGEGLHVRGWFVTLNLFSGDVRHIEPFSKHGPYGLEEVRGIGRSSGGFRRST